MRTLSVSSALAFLLGVFAHIEVLGHWFTSYDSIALIETSRIESPGDLWSLLTKPLMHGTTYVEAGEFYRPAASLTYAIEYWVWGANPFGYHLTDLLLHGFAPALVVLAVYTLTESLPTGALTGALFAIHPLSVDTVPAISRRQDVLMAVFCLLALWLFVEGVRRENGRLRSGAVVAYALALLSKETAIVLGPLAFLWVVLRQPSLRRPETYVRALTATLPLAAVTVAYLALRTAVLGGIGGYTHDPSLSQTLLFPFEYVLSLTYQAHVFGVLGEHSLLALVVITAGTPVAYLLLLGRTRAVDEVGAPQFLFVAIAIAGFATLTATFLLPDALASLNLEEVRSVEWYVVGVVFAVGAGALLGGALSSGRQSNTGSRRLNGFFLAWLAMPMPLFFVARQFAFRDAYFFAIPLLALLATCLVDGLGLDSQRRAVSWNGTDVLLVLAVLVLLGPSLAASPLLYTDSGWSDGGDITREALTQVERSVETADANARVFVLGAPTRIRHDPRQLGQARKVTMLQPHSVRSWLRLHGHENRVAVRLMGPFDTAPRNVSTTIEKGDRRLIVRLHYN